MTTKRAKFTAHPDASPAMTDQITVEHGYGDPRLQRISKRDDNRVVLDTYLAMIELRLAGYDAFVTTPQPHSRGTLWYRTVVPYDVADPGVRNDEATGYQPARRVYGPNNVLALLDAADRNPDATLAPKIVTERKVLTGLTCLACGSPTLTVDGEWSLGVTLPTGYTPAPGELVKNHWMECSSEACGFNQAS